MIMENLFLKEKLHDLIVYKPINDDLMFTLFTKVDEEKNLLNICVCDGNDIYTKEILNEDLLTLAEDCGFATKETFLSKLRDCIEENKYTISKFSDHALVQYENGSSCSFSMKLYKPSASEKKVFFKFSYFQMAEKHRKLQIKMKEMENELDKLKNEVKTTPVITSETLMPSIYEPEFKRPKQNKPKAVKGGSLINPGTRRKKAASGVVFDDD